MAPLGVHTGSCHKVGWCVRKARGALGVLVGGLAGSMGEIFPVARGWAS